MPAAKVAEALMAGIEHDEWEIPSGQTAGLRAFFLSAPQQAFEMLN